MDNKKTCAWGRVPMKALSHRVSSQQWHFGPHTKETRADRAFCVSGRNPRVSNEPEWAARKKTPATLHPSHGRLNFDQVSVKSHGQAVRQPCDESEWSAYGRASLSRLLGIRWAGLITLGNAIV